MDEAHFWLFLEFRICHEFAGMPERRVRYYWCDGFTPEKYILDGSSPRITGQCWICNGPQAAEWEFALLLAGSPRTREDIEWAALLPPANVTRWMSFDEGRQYIEIDPAVAVPDLR